MTELTLKLNAYVGGTYLRMLPNFSYESTIGRRIYKIWCNRALTICNTFSSKWSEGVYCIVIYMNPFCMIFIDKEWLILISYYWYDWLIPSMVCYRLWMSGYISNVFAHKWIVICTFLGGGVKFRFGSGFTLFQKIFELLDLMQNLSSAHNHLANL